MFTYIAVRVQSLYSIVNFSLNVSLFLEVVCPLNSGICLYYRKSSRSSTQRLVCCINIKIAVKEKLCANLHA